MTMGFHPQEVDSHRIRQMQERHEQRWRMRKAQRDQVVVARAIARGDMSPLGMADPLPDGDPRTKLQRLRDLDKTIEEQQQGEVTETVELPPEQVSFLPPQLLAELAAFYTNRQWGSLTIDFADGRPTLVRATRTSKIEVD